MRSVRLQPYAQRLYRQPCRQVNVGDSINSDHNAANMAFGYQQKYRPRIWSGWCTGGNDDGTGIAGGIMNFAKVRGQYSGFGAGIGGTGGTPSSGVAAEANIWPSYFGDTTLEPADVTAGTTIYFSNPAAGVMAQFQGGDWSAGKNVTARLVMFRSTTKGFATIGTFGDRTPGGTSNTVASAALGIGAYTNLDVAIPNDAGKDMQWLLMGANPNIDETGLNAYLCGARFFVDELGLQLAFLGVGGSGAADHINTTNVADSAIAQCVSSYNANTVQIWLGQNDTINATWTTNMLALIQRWRAAIGSSFKCLLVSQYICTGTNAAKIEAIWQAISQIAANFSDVSAIDLGGADGGFAAAQGASFLGDGVHPTHTGASYFAGLMDAGFQYALATGGTAGLARIPGNNERVARTCRVIRT